MLITAEETATPLVVVATAHRPAQVLVQITRILALTSQAGMGTPTVPHPWVADPTQLVNPMADTALQLVTDTTEIIPLAINTLADKARLSKIVVNFSLAIMLRKLVLVTASSTALRLGRSLYRVRRTTKT